MTSARERRPHRRWPRAPGTAAARKPCGVGSIVRASTVATTAPRAVASTAKARRSADLPDPAMPWPGSLSQPGRAGLGTQPGEACLREVLQAGGFGDVRRAAETPFNPVLEARLP
jgi:hypothetical protein